MEAGNIPEYTLGAQPREELRDSLFQVLAEIKEENAYFDDVCREEVLHTCYKQACELHESDNFYLKLSAQLKPQSWGKNTKCFNNKF